jgi:hypothetical protein
MIIDEPMMDRTDATRMATTRAIPYDDGVTILIVEIRVTRWVS